MKITLTNQCQKELQQLHKNQPGYAKSVALKMQKITN